MTDEEEWKRVTGNKTNGSRKHKKKGVGGVKKEKKSSHIMLHYVAF